MADTSKWKVGIKQGANWGDAVAVGANDGVLLVSESLSEGIPEAVPDESIGMSMAGTPLQGNIKTEGNVVETVRYEGFERHLALFCGGDTPALVDGATAAHAHTMPFLASNSGKFATVAIDKAVGSLYEYPSVKFNQLELAHDKGRLQATLSCIANRCNRASTLNTPASLAALSYPSVGLMAIFNQLKVRLHQLTGTESNLADADELLVSSAKLSLNRNLAGDYVCGSRSGEVDEPSSNGFPSGTLELTFPKHTAAVDTLIALAQTRAAGCVPPSFKASLVWTGPVLEAAIPYSLTAMFANLTIAKAPANAGSPGAKVPVTMTFNVSAPASDGLGSDWTWAKAGGSPAMFVVVNKNSSAAA